MAYFQKNAIWLNIALAIAITGFTFWAQNSAEEFWRLEPSAYGKYAPFLMNIVVVDILIYLFVRSRTALITGIIAGLLWLAAGDLMAMPYWITTMGFWCYVFMEIKKRKPLETHHFWYFLMWAGSAINYNIAWSGAKYYGYLILLVFLLIFIIPGVSAENPEESDDEDCCEEGCCEECCDGCEECDENYARPFEAEIVQLESYKNLPANIRNELKNIIKYARLIQDSMLTDPRDVKPGEKFMQRYLPATLEIVEKGHSLSKKLKKHGNERELTARKLEMLKVLHSAFRQKHAQLLENDENELQTDMSTLEKLLKTDGFL